MLNNHLRLAFRRLGRQKLTTSLHIAGLTLGMGVCLLIGLFLRHELSFDKYHAKAERTYRVNQIWSDFGKKEPYYSTPFPLAEYLRTDFPEFEHITRVHHPPPAPIIEINPHKRFKQEFVMFTDPEFLEVFDVEVLSGNGHEALRQPYQALLTQSTAEKFFGREDPLGKTFKYNTDYTVTVAGVIRDLPGNTHLPAQVLLSLSTDEKYIQTSNTQLGFVTGGSTFVVLPEGLDPKSLASRLKAIYDRTVNKESGAGSGFRADLELQPLSDIHLNTQYGDGGAWVKAVNPAWLWFFGCVGLVVLALACINFVNLSTAQALTRAKEVGVRKSVGAGRWQLIGQFMGEAWLLALGSGVLAVMVAQYALPSINNLLDKKIIFELADSLGLIGALLTGVFFTGLLAGLYPAWIISRFQPASTLKTGVTIAGDKGSAGLRKVLVVAQFTISVGLLIALILIGKQMNYLRSKNLGFEKDNTVIVQAPENKKLPVLAAGLAAIPQVKGVAFSTSPPSGEGHWGTRMSLKGRDDPDRQPVNTIYADEQYCRLYGLELVAGRFYEPADTHAVSESLPEDQRFPKCVVNEKLVRTLGFESPEASLGKRFWIGMMGWNAEITGVIKDFNTNSLHEEVNPLLITQYNNFYDRVSIRIEGGSDMPATLRAIETAWEKSFPQGVFEFKFLDQTIDTFYKAEERLFQLFRVFAGLAMFISCLGLWGLAAFAAQQRTKEIGIRKVFGASVEGIVALLSKEFLKLVGIAILIASPLAYFGMNKWLQDFAFRIDIGWKVFLLAGLGAVVIAFLTVSFQAVRAALTNPVKSLRSE